MERGLMLSRAATRDLRGDQAQGIMQDVARINDAKLHTSAVQGVINQ
jgi:hypothetical protein